jgi:hypothetical protein
MVAEFAQLAAGALTSTLVAAGIVLLLQRVMQVGCDAAGFCLACLLRY